MDLPRPPKDIAPEMQRFLTTLLQQVGDAEKTNRKTVSDVEVASGQRLILLGDDGLKYTVAIVGGSLTATPL